VVVSIVAVQYSSQRLLWLIPFIVLIILGSLTVYENYRTTADYNNTIVSRYNTAHRISSGQAK
jgi:cytochrome c-type biogenesis protein CcmH/NrfF